MMNFPSSGYRRKDLKDRNLTSYYLGLAWLYI